MTRQQVEGRGQLEALDAGRGRFIPQVDAGRVIQPHVRVRRVGRGTPASPAGGYGRVARVATCEDGSGGAGDAEGVCGEELRGAGLVELVALEDLEACVGE